MNSSVTDTWDDLPSGCRGVVIFWVWSVCLALIAVFGANHHLVLMSFFIMLLLSHVVYLIVEAWSDI